MPDGSPTTQRSGLQAGVTQILDQPLGAAAADFLIIADEQVQRPDQRARLKIRHRGEAGGDEALHVAASAGEQFSVPAAQTRTDRQSRPDHQPGLYRHGR